MEREDELKRIAEEIVAGLRDTADLPSLEEFRVRMTGKKGELTRLLKTLGSLDPEERKEFGKKVNDLRRTFEEGFEAAKDYLSEKRSARAISEETLDVTLPGVKRRVGSRHPISSVYDELIDLFIGLGFTVEEGPHIETEYYNFEALNTPRDHPSRDEQDTFYIADSIVLRTHMSPVQVRTMERGRLPIRIIAPGKVFRADEIDATHTPVFHQIEGLVVDKGITFGHMKGLFEMFCAHMYGPETKIRLRPSYFPFTEPSAEVDATCHACGGKPDGCRVCKDSGWVEMWGCGMVHPNVLRMSGIDPEVYSGYAFGMGMDRAASLIYGITDPRLYFENDMQFLTQF